MAKIRNVSKSLASMEDLLQGKGAVTQTRGKEVVEVHHVDVPFAVSSVAEMQALDVTRYTRSRVYYDTTTFVDYVYDSEATEGIKPELGNGYWVEGRKALSSTNSTTPRAVADWLADAMNCKAFGCIGDYVNVDTTGMQSALVSSQAEGKILHIPAGVYLLDAKLLATADKPLTIVGDGMHRSILVWTNADGGISYNGGTITQSKTNTLELKDIGLATTQEGGGSALAVAYAGGGGTTTTVATLTRVSCYGLNDNSAYWNIGFNLDNARNSSLTNCVVIGAASNQVAMTAAYRISDSLVANPVDIILSNCQAFYCDRAVDIGDDGNGNAEGVSVIGGRYVLNNYGVYWKTLNNKPLLHVVDSHIASRVCNVYTRKNVQGIISGNLFYVRDETTVDFTSIDVQADLSVTLDVNISDNVIRCNKGLVPATNGIKVEGARGLVIGNNITEPDTGVELGANSNNIIVAHSSIRLPVTAYSDSGTANKIIDFERGNLRVASGSPKASYIDIEGSDSASGPKVKADGPDADIALRLAAKGTGIIQFLTGLTEQMRVLTDVDAVNYFRTGGSPTGTAVQLAARGTDADIDLELSPQGTGNVKFGVHTASADAAVTGYITIKDSGGVVRKLALIS